MDNMFTGHNCNECHAKGQCSLEVAVRFFDGHKEMMDELDLLRKALGQWKTALMADASTSPQDAPSYIIEVAMATGFVLARGATPLSTEPSMNHVMKSITDLVRGLQQPPPFNSEDSLN